MHEFHIFYSLTEWYLFFPTAQLHVREGRSNEITLLADDSNFLLLLLFVYE